MQKKFLKKIRVIPKFFRNTLVLGKELIKYGAEIVIIYIVYQNCDVTKIQEYVVEKIRAVIKVIKNQKKDEFTTLEGLPDDFPVEIKVSKKNGDDIKIRFPSKSKILTID